MIKRILVKWCRDVIARKRRSKLRSMMRGYRKLKEESKLSEIQELKAELSAEELVQLGSKASKIMFGAAADNADILIKQYMYAKLLLNPKFNMAVLYSIGACVPIKYPLPGKWQKKLRNKGYIVDSFSCYLLWVSYIVLYFCFGVYRVIQVIISTIISKKNNIARKNEPYAYFANMSASNIPSCSERFEDRNIITWYKTWDRRHSDVEFLCHDAKRVKDFSIDGFKIHHFSFTKFSLFGLKSTSLFFLWCIKATAICLKDILLFRWWTLLLFEQFVLAALIRCTDKKFIAKDYFFHNSTWIYRPMWTYEAEKSGSRIMFYFYSTNVVEFIPKCGYPDNVNGWNLASWPNVLVWDEYQADFVKSKFNSVKDIKIVGPILISTSNSKLTIDSKFKNMKKAAIFDVLPRRSSVFQLLGTLTEYYSARIPIQFLNDVYDVMYENNMLILHKCKRNSRTTHPSYEAAMLNNGRETQVMVDPETSAIEVIAKADIVISMPFTSTAILARQQNKPSIFYDPFGDLEHDDRRHGVPIVVGKNNLREWLNCNLANE
jgi:polysaccharide biosynthesis PFTS motif protein